MGNSQTYVKDEEELAVHIFELVHKSYPEDCEKITGMLLETNVDELNEVLRNHEELEKRIHLAAKVIQDKKLTSFCVSSDVNDDSEVLGNKIYGVVQQLYPVFAENVTGMLLEMDKQRLIGLLNNKDDLIDHIHTAAKVYMENEKENRNTRTNDNHHTSNKSQQDVKIINESTTFDQEKEALGEQIYLKIVTDFPTEAAKITGMFLEMDLQRLKQTVEDHDLFNQKLSDAIRVLQEAEEGTLYCITNDNHHTIQKSQQDVKIINESQTFDQEKEALGEQIYLKIVTEFPTEAAKITGMFLEMDLQRLKQTVEDHDLFDQKLSDAIRVLQEAEERTVTGKQL